MPKRLRKSKKSLRSRLRHDHQVLGRRIAVDAFEQCDGDPVEFERLARADSRLVGIDPATIALIIQLVTILFKWWSSRNVQFPSREAVFSLPDDVDVDVEDPVIPASDSSTADDSGLDTETDTETADE